MKKIIFLLLMSLFFHFFLINSLSAQPSTQDLDQTELVKKFIGTWEVSIGEDSIMLWELYPSNKGYELNVSWQTKGETYLTVPGLMGFTQNYNQIVMSHLFPNGELTKEIGEFVNDTKMILDRYSGDHKHITSTIEINFITPDKFTGIYKIRGMKESWDKAIVIKETYIRIK